MSNRLRIRQFASNMTVLSRDDWEILFSYETPVAGMRTLESGRREAFKTDQWFSVTTSKHIGKYLSSIGLSNVVTLPQFDIERLAA